MERRPETGRGNATAPACHIALQRQVVSTSSALMELVRTRCGCSGHSKGHKPLLEEEEALPSPSELCAVASQCGASSRDFQWTHVPLASKTRSGSPSEVLGNDIPCPSIGGRCRCRRSPKFLLYDTTCTRRVSGRRSLCMPDPMAPESACGIRSQKSETITRNVWRLARIDKWAHQHGGRPRHSSSCSK